MLNKNQFRAVEQEYAANEIEIARLTERNRQIATALEMLTGHKVAAPKKGHRSKTRKVAAGTLQGHVLKVLADGEPCTADQTIERLRKEGVEFHSRSVSPTLSELVRKRKLCKTTTTKPHAYALKVRPVKPAEPEVKESSPLLPFTEATIGHGTKIRRIHEN